MIPNTAKKEVQKVVDLLKELPALFSLNETQTRSLESIISDSAQFIAYNECGIALECLCENLYEDSIPISQGVLDAILEAAEVGKIHSGYTNSLDELVKKVNE